MVEVDGVLVILIILMGVVGLVRGFLRELGVTLVLVATLWALTMVLPFLEDFFNRGGFPFLGLGPVADTPSTQRLLFVLFSALIIIAAYISYAGETLSYEGTPPKGLLGVALGFLIGAVNGYLVFGTLWWLADHYQYPFDIIAQPIPEAAQQILSSHLLPPNLLASGPGPFNLLAVALIILVLLKVVR